MLAVFGCWLGRLVGPRIGLCPYVLSAQLSALVPFLFGLLQGVEVTLAHLAIGAGSALGVYVTGHSPRDKALLGSALGGVLAWGLWQQVLG